MPGTEQRHKTLKGNRLSFGYNVRMDPNLANAYIKFSVSPPPGVRRVHPAIVIYNLALD